MQNQVPSLKRQIEELSNLKDMLMLEKTILGQRFAALNNETLLKQGDPITLTHSLIYRHTSLLYTFAHWFVEYIFL